MIRFGKLNFSYKNTSLFNNFDLTIKEGITSIIGPNGCGKSTLMKILLGLVSYDGEVIVDDFNDVESIRKNTGFVLENPDNQIVNEIVFDDIAYTLKNTGESKVKDKVWEISKKLHIENILDSNINDLNNNQKQLVCLASALVHNPKILILDEALAIFDPDTKEMVLSLLCELKKKMTIIIISHDIEDTLISDEIIVLNKGEVILQGSKEDIYNNEKELNKMGYSLPFMVELSNRLMFYGLVDHVIYDMKEMVDVLWQ